MPYRMVPYRMREIKYGIPLRMSNMEDDARRYLNKIMSTLGLGLLWLFINMTMGIYNGWFFFSRKPTAGNYIFYGWAILSLIGLLIIYKKSGKRNSPMDNSFNLQPGRFKPAPIHRSIPGRAIAFLHLLTRLSTPFAPIVR